MNTLAFRMLACVILAGLIGAPVQAHAAERVRGAITRMMGDELEIKTRDGKAITIKLTDSTKVNAVLPARMSDIKRGSFVGITAVPGGPENSLRALEVHIFPEAQRGTGEGHYDWDLAPGSTMTNADVAATVLYHKGKQLMLRYKGGTQKITVPNGVPIVTFSPGDRSLLTAGTQVFVLVQPGADGSLTALRIIAGKDGMTPPM